MSRPRPTKQLMATKTLEETTVQTIEVTLSDLQLNLILTALNLYQDGLSPLDDLFERVNELAGKLDAYL